MKYEDFLFSQLFMNYIENNETEYQELEYDIIFPEVLKHYEEYKASIYFLGAKSEYECILEYFSNEVVMMSEVRALLTLQNQNQNRKSKVIVSDLEGLSKEVLSKIEIPMFYIGEYEESGDIFADLRNSKNEPIRVFHERLKDFEI